MVQTEVFQWADPSSLRCEAREAFGVVEVTLPNRATLRIDEEYFPINWKPVFMSDNASTRLWHRSLAYLPAISKLPEGWGLVERILVEFLQLISGDLTRARIPSMDHALAIQIRICHELRLRAKDAGAGREGLISVIDDLLPRLLRLAREPGMRVPNNHGVMLSVALLLISTQHPSLVSDGDAKADATVAMAQVDEIFDEDGLSHENTTSYQKLYVKLLQNLCKLASESERLKPFAIALTLAYERASVAYRRQLLPDGHVPPLGDGGMGKETQFDALPGKLISPRNGLFVHSDEHSYVSMICGARSPIHKQMDDTSIMMGTAGRLLVLDAGVQNYDAEDRGAASIRTQLGHSGLFFPRFDDKPLKYFNSGSELGARKVDASMTVTPAEEFDQVICRYSLEGHTAERVARIASPTSVLLIDKAWSPNKESAVARFLLNGSLKLTSATGRLDGSDGSRWVRFLFSESAAIVVYSGLVSWSLSERTPCWIVEMEVPSGGRPSQIAIDVGSELL